MTKQASNIVFIGGAKATGLPASTANGEAVVHEQLAAVLGGASYQGTWNANTNTPAIPAAATGNKGHYYVVSVAGTTNQGGITDWEVGDWIISNGTAWQKVDNTEPAASDTVAGNVELATTAETNTGTDTSRAVTPAGLAASNYAAKRFSSTIGDGSATSIAVTHNFGTQDIVASIREVSTNAVVIADITSTSTNVATFSFVSAPASNAYRVTILG